MKKKVLCVCFVLLGLFMYSCSSDIEVYSCDPEIDGWVKEHKREIRSMTRSNVLELADVNLQRAVFTAFDPDQMYYFWKEKISEVLYLNWNMQEQEHIKQIDVFIDENKDIFTKGMSDAGSIFIYKWIEHAREELNWDDKQIYGVIMEGNKLLDTSGNLEITQRGETMRLRTNSERSCDCHKGNVAFTTCGSLMGVWCEDVSCDQSVRGCGAFWTEACDGLCLPR